jgi:hypothetical protein
MSLLWTIRFADLLPLRQPANRTNSLRPILLLPLPLNGHTGPQWLQLQCPRCPGKNNAIAKLIGYMHDVLRL